MHAPKQPQPPHDEQPADDVRRWLSALADGESAVVESACRSWRDDADARRTWHAYHLIGDVLRSDELAHPAQRDADFLAGLRRRLAAEPVRLAPRPPAPRRQAWLMPVTAAAGVAAVAGVLVLARLGPAESPLGVLAGASGPGLTAAGIDRRPAAPSAREGGGFIRDPRLDEYLRAHQAARGGVAAASPGGTLRRVDVAVPAGAPR